MGVASDIFGVGGLATSIASIVGKFIPDRTQQILLQAQIQQLLIDAEAPTLLRPATRHCLSPGGVRLWDGFVVLH